ncbi:DsbA family protein [Hoeflea sp.]|uniref:DsbA family protein n=1 Tax=Hoeflea sp. TaxID=1940281 RepID=UPI00374956F3
MTQQTLTKTITLQYLFDPLCGWCYGASATVAELAQHPDIELQPLATGLFSGRGARSMEGFAAQAWQADQRIAQLSGRGFSEAYRRDVLGAKGAMLDSSVATLAVTAVSLEAPEREIEALKAIQEARYVGGKDVTSAKVVADLLNGLGLIRSAVLVIEPDEALVRLLQERMAEAHATMSKFHVQGVPALIVGTGDARQPMNASALYSGTDPMLAALGLI